MMTNTGDRIDEFKSDIAAMKLKTGSASKEQPLLVASVLVMLAGIVLAIVSFFSSANQSDVRDQNELIILAITGLAISVVGAALFLRYSLAKFLRFWLLRQSYEQQAAIEEIARRLGH
jgi:hypothetical protein